MSCVAINRRDNQKQSRTIEEKVSQSVFFFLLGMCVFQTNEAGDPIEPFNLRNERDIGFFDANGNFVWKVKKKGAVLSSLLRRRRLVLGF